MSEILLEADYVKVDLRSIINSAKAPASEETSTDGTVTTDSAALPKRGEWLEWGELRKQRLATNAAKKPGEAKSEYEVETEFFKEFYNANWDKEIAEKLIALGEPLKKLLKVIGFKKSNPILVFINQEFVQKVLLHANLLNVNTFKVIYNAIVTHLLADSEFFKRNTYNLIYCKDFYRKPIKDMEEFLKVQKTFLNPSAEQYTNKATLLNRIAFFNISSIKEPDVIRRADTLKKLYQENKLTDDNIPTAYEASLNNLAVAKELADKLGFRVTDTKKSSASMGAKSMNSLINKINTKWGLSHYFAVILHLSTTSDLLEVRRALHHDKFKGLSGDDIAAASTEVAPLLGKGKLPDEEVKMLVATILDNLK